MKRVRKSAEIPDRLFLYAQLHPHDTWDKFHHRDRNGYKQVKQQLMKDQYGLCAYCEISIRLTDNEDLVDDFRVEHFHPKTGTENHEHNYHLDWNNMLGACHGGSHPYVEDAKYRYSAAKEDRSCDVPKGCKSLDTRILNPLEIPGNIRLFKYDPFSGEMQVDETQCEGKLRKRAKVTIKELNLNAPRLKRLRKAVLDVLQEQVDASLQQGRPLALILSELAEELLDPGQDGRYPDFFTAIRWFLGEAAEDFLRKRDFVI